MCCVHPSPWSRPGLTSTLPPPSDAPWPGGHGQMQSGEKEGETGLARQGRGKSPRATEGAPLRSGALFALSLGLQEKPQNPRRSFQNTAGSLVASGPAQGQSVYWIVVEMPTAGAGSGAGPTPGLIGRAHLTSSGPRGQGQPVCSGAL